MKAPGNRRGLALALAALTLLAPDIASSAAAKAFRTKCIHVKGVHDGDTLTCVSNAGRGSFVVRFAGIDAPESGQAYWRVARDRLKEMARSGTVAECYKQDRYGRQVCRLYSPDGKDLADAMIGEGLAWHAVQFAHEQTPEERLRYAELERSAKVAKRGLWEDADPMPPSECRQMKAQKSKCR